MRTCGISSFSQWRATAVKFYRLRDSAMAGFGNIGFSMSRRCLLAPWIPVARGAVGFPWIPCPPADTPRVPTSAPP